MDGTAHPGGEAPNRDIRFTSGIRVSARGLVWDVLEVNQLGGQCRLRLRCAGGDLRGLEWDILHPAEPVEILRSELRPEAPGSLAVWRLFHTAALLEQAPGPTELLSIEPGRLRVEPYQLVPLMRALELPRPRLLLADGVGLGKTIEAGLIATELIARRQAHRVLVVAPAGPLLLQWEQEMRQRFGLRFVTITNSATLQVERRKIELGGNPFDGIALCLVSLDFAKQERVLEELERSAWDLAVIDEAHHCVGATAGTDREDTQRRRLAEVIAQRSDGLLLLTATPHDGYDPHFASLIELLDPSLVDGQGGLAGPEYRRHVIRRLKSHIVDPVSGAPLFRERRVIPVRVGVGGIGAASVRDFHKALGAMVAPRLRRAMRARQYADALAFVSLLKRSVSTIGACLNTLQVVLQRYRHLGVAAADAAELRRERARSLRAYRRKALRFGTLDAADESDEAQLEAEEIAADLASFGAEELARELASIGRETSCASDTVQALEKLIRLGTAAEPDDPKLHALLRQVASIRAAQPGANILVYTEYADSQLSALRTLRAACVDGEVLAISGLDPEEERSKVAERCAEQDGIILISTDSMAEGLNLQRRCCHLIHLDLPYNPNRLEQRNGRIDRYGQTREPQIRYLYLADTFEERLLLRLIAKYEKARARLTFMPETLGVTADEATWNVGLVAGFAERQASLFVEEPPTIRTLDHIAEESNAESYRELLHEIDRAFAGYERSAVRHGWAAEQGRDADATQLAAADALHRRSDALLGHVDLLDFVVAAIEAEAGKAEIEAGLLLLPADWLDGLDGLPGFDRGARTLRVTRERSRLYDAQQRSVAYLGRAHPLVQRAISRVQRIERAAGDGVVDSRVSAARTKNGAPLSLLLTYSVEMHSARRIEWQRLIAVRLLETGSPKELPDPASWLRLAARGCEVPTDRLWRALFAHWAIGRQRDAEALAIAAMQRIATEFAAGHRRRLDHAAQELEHWLGARADDICGRRMPRTDDLFDPVSPGPDWQTLSVPCDRLAAYAVDGTNPPARRREANTAVELFRRRGRRHAERAELSPPVLRACGMLMLVPPGLHW